MRELCVSDGHHACALTRSSGTARTGWRTGKTWRTGIESAPAHLIKTMRGENFGRPLIRV